MAFVGRLLLQDLHVAEVVLEQGLRAVHPPRRGPRQGAFGCRSRHLCQPLRPLRRAGRRLRPGWPAAVRAAISARKVAMLVASWGTKAWVKIGRASCRERVCQYV